LAEIVLLRPPGGRISTLTGWLGFFANFSGSLSASKARRKRLCDRALWSLVAGTWCRQFEGRQENLGRIPLKEFRSPNRPLGYKIKIPALHDFNAGILLFFIILLTPEKWGHWLWLSGGPIRPGVLSRKQGHASTVRAFPAGPARDERLLSK
jgi:hypothetical protein